MKYKGVIFDVDGTLIDSIEDIGDSMNQVLEEEGKDTFTYDEYKDKVGRGFRNLVINSFDENLDMRELNRLIKRLEKIYSEKYLNKTKAFEGIEELLEKLESENIQMGIYTNKKEEYTVSIVEKLFGDYEFVEVLGQVEGRAIKPSPMGLNMILEKMNLDNSEILYIGDSDVDMMTGNNGDVDTVGVSWGFRSVEELKDTGADYIVDSPEEIWEIIAG